MVDRVEDASKSDIVGWQGEDMMMKSMVMEKVHGVVNGHCNVEGRGCDMACTQFKGL